jgi:hypothetical protein
MQASSFAQASITKVGSVPELHEVRVLQNGRGA